VSIMSITEVKEPQRERSLSPMELDSPISTPPQSPIISSAKSPRLNTTQISSGMSLPLSSSTPDGRSYSSSNIVLESVPPIALPTTSTFVDGRALSNHSIALQSLTPMGSNVPRNFKTLNGSTAPAQVPVSRLLSATDHIPKAMALSATKPDVTSATEAGLASIHSGTEPKPQGYEPSARRGKTLVANPFVSGGFVTEFVSGQKAQNTVPKGVKEWFSAETTSDIKVSARVTTPILGP
jgi:hypothetical protein